MLESYRYRSKSMPALFEKLRLAAIPVPFGIWTEYQSSSPLLRFP